MEGGGGYSASLTQRIAPLGCTLEKVQGCVRSKVWLGLVNRHSLYGSFAAASHNSQQPWLEPSWRSNGELAVCNSWQIYREREREIQCHGMYLYQFSCVRRQNNKVNLHKI